MRSGEMLHLPADSKSIRSLNYRSAWAVSGRHLGICEVISNKRLYTL